MTLNIWGKKQYWHLKNYLLTDVDTNLFAEDCLHEVIMLKLTAA